MTFSIFKVMTRSNSEEERSAGRSGRCTEGVVTVSQTWLFVLKMKSFQTMCDPCNMNLGDINNNQVYQT